MGKNGGGCFLRPPSPPRAGDGTCLTHSKQCYTPRHVVSILSFLERKDPRGSWGSWWSIDGVSFRSLPSPGQGSLTPPTPGPFWLRITLYLLLQVLDKVVFKDREEGGCWASGEVHGRCCAVLEHRNWWDSRERLDLEDGLENEWAVISGWPYTSGECPTWEF